MTKQTNINKYRVTAKLAYKNLKETSFYRKIIQIKSKKKDDNIYK